MKRNRWRVSRFPMALLWGALLLFSCSQHDLRVQQLRDLQAQNQADTVFRSDSLQRILVDYFNRHGSANEKMLANYLLGRAYYDMGETPLALHYYHEAIDCADTTAADCDFIILSRVYGQKAITMYGQRMLDDCIPNFMNAYRMALLAKDTLYAIRFLEHTSGAYYLLNKKDSAYLICKRSEEESVKSGLYKEAVNTYPTMILLLLEKNNYQEAKVLMSRYEKESGLFDENNNIAKGREQYYYYKGVYYLAYNQLDSAEYYFRKHMRCIQTINDYETCYRGMLSLYEKKRNADSIAKYSHLFCDANDSAHRSRSTEQMLRLEKLYNYSRQQSIAKEATQKASKALFVNMILGVVLIILFAIGVWVYRIIRTKQRRQLIAENRKYNDVLDRLIESERTMIHLKEMSDSLRTLNDELHNQCDHNENKLKLQGQSVNALTLELERERQKNLRLKKELERLSDDGTTVIWNLKDAMVEDETIGRLHELARHGHSASDMAWRRLLIVMSEKQKCFYDYVMNDNYHLTSMEQRVCLLIRLRFIRSEISTLLDKSPQHVTNMCSSINAKLFGFQGTKGLNTRIQGIE